jgi:hypothetical protein
VGWARIAHFWNALSGLLAMLKAIFWTAIFTRAAKGIFIGFHNHLPILAILPKVKLLSSPILLKVKIVVEISRGIF